MAERIVAKKELTAARLREVVSYDPYSGIFRWIKQLGSRARVGEVAGCPDAYGYLIFQIDGTLYKAHRLAWLYMKGEWPKDEIDHKNRAPGDNRFFNLRPATQKQNCENSSMRVDNTSGARGVWWHKQVNKWAAEIMHNGKKIHLGCYSDIESAKKARSEMERKLYTHTSL